MPDSRHRTSSVDLAGVPLLSFLGTSDAAIRRLGALFPEVEFRVHDGRVDVSGPDDAVAAAVRVLGGLRDLARGGVLTAADVDSVASLVRDTDEHRPVDVLSQAILTARGRSIRPKTLGQKRYVDAIDRNTIVFGIGPAGTGKTYLAMAKAVQALQGKQVSRIVLTRPAVEAGERLGFLPGTLGEKIDPYLRPLFDALAEMMEPETVTKLMEYGVIEVAPLAYMRGRTLNDAFIILDEAQNTTPEQMKMFLTRLGFGSIMVVTGDVTQVDLNAGRSGLEQVTHILEGIDDIHMAYLTSEDVVRHQLVTRIIEAYERQGGHR